MTDKNQIINDIDGHPILGYSSIKSVHKEAKSIDKTITLDVVKDYFSTLTSTQVEFKYKGNNSFEWVCNLEDGLKEGKWMLQPGNYKLVYREKDQKSTAYTKEKSFKIESNRTLNLNL